MTSCDRALEMTGSEIIETTVSTRRLSWAGRVIRVSGGRLPKRIVFGNLKEERRGWGGKEKVDRLSAERGPGVWHSGGLESDGVGGRGVD